MIGNTGGYGGGIYLGNSDPVIENCTIAGNNSTGSGGGGIHCYRSSPTITNCTFADNEGDHIWCDGSSPTIEYSILAFAGPGDPVLCMDGTETPHIHHCFVHGNAASDTLCGGNFSDIVNLDPLFCDMLNEDYRLCGDSPCLGGATWPQLVGANAQGCPPCGSAVEPLSWGAIKALYR